MKYLDPKQSAATQQKIAAAWGREFRRDFSSLCHSETNIENLAQHALEFYLGTTDLPGVPEACREMAMEVQHLCILAKLGIDPINNAARAGAWWVALYWRLEKSSPGATRYPQREFIDKEMQLHPERKTVQNIENGLKKHRQKTGMEFDEDDVIRWQKKIRKTT